MTGNLLYRKIPYRVIRRLRSQVRVAIGSTNVHVPINKSEALAWIYWNSSWKSHLFDRLLDGQSGSIFDLGANIGQSMADYLSTDRENDYWALEPNPACVYFLNQLKQLNDWPQVEIVASGAWNSHSFLKLNVDNNDPVAQTATVVPSLRPEKSIGNSHWVSCSPFDKLLKLTNATPPALIKIDVEGAELEVLQGMTKSLCNDRPAIICEILFAAENADLEEYAATVQKLRDLLTAHDYRLFNIEKSDSAQFLRLRPLDNFPIQRWTHQNADQCDYVFSHRDDPRTYLLL